MPTTILLMLAYFISRSKFFILIAGNESDITVLATCCLMEIVEKGSFMKKHVCFYLVCFCSDVFLIDIYEL